MTADKMVFDARTMDEIMAMQPHEKLEAIRKAIYGDDDLTHVLMTVVAAAAPEAMPDVLTWVRSKISASSEQTSVVPLPR